MEPLSEPLSFEELCERHYERVVRTAYLITGDRQEALDIAQEAFVRAFERWKQVAAMSNPEGWLFSVVANLAVSFRRRWHRRPRLASGPEMALQPELRDPELHAALTRLPPAQRTAVVMRFYLDWSVQDVAAALGKRPGTVRALTSQGVARLREQLGQSFFEEEDDEPIVS